MTQYRVALEADIEADSPEDAARQARAMQTGPVTMAAPVPCTVNVWVLTGNGDCCPATVVTTTEWDGWLAAAKWLEENCPEALEEEVEELGATHAALLKAAMAKPEVAALRQVVERIAEREDSEIRVERHVVVAPSKTVSKSFGAPYSEEARIAALWRCPRVPTAVLWLEGGCVQGIVSDVPMLFGVIDYDTDDLREEEIKQIPQSLTPQQSAAGMNSVAPAGGFVSVADFNPQRTQELYVALGGTPSVRGPLTEEEWMEAREAAAEATVVRRAKCPYCGTEGEIYLRFDAWEDWQVLGFNAEGKPVQSVMRDTWAGDDHHFECRQCGKWIDEALIVAVQPEGERRQTVCPRDSQSGPHLPSNPDVAQTVCGNCGETLFIDERTGVWYSEVEPGEDA